MRATDDVFGVGYMQHVCYSACSRLVSPFSIRFERSVEGSGSGGENPHAFTKYYSSIMTSTLSGVLDQKRKNDLRATYILPEVKIKTKQRGGISGGN